MLKEAQAAMFIFLFAMMGFAVNGGIIRSNARMTDILYLYAQRVYRAAWDYSAVAATTLRDVPAQQLSPAILETSRHGIGLSEWAPNGQPVRLYSYGNGRAATLYAVIAAGGSWIGAGNAVYLRAANRFGARGGTVEGNEIVFRAGGGRVDLRSLSGFAAQDGDLVLRIQTLVAN